MNTNKKEQIKMHIKLGVLSFINRTLSVAAGMTIAILGVVYLAPPY